MEKVAKEIGMGMGSSSGMTTMEKPYVVMNEKRFYPEKRKFKHLKTIGQLMIRTITTLAVAQELGEKEMAMMAQDILDAPHKIMVELYPDMTEEDIEESFLEEIVEAFFAAIKQQGLESLKNSMTPLRQTMTLAK